MNKLTTLAAFLEVAADEIQQGYDSSVFEINGAEYLVLTDSEAEEKTIEYIEETLWAFNTDFLANCTGIDGIVFEKLCELCEDGNAAIMAIVDATCGISEVIDTAVSIDGRGHYLNSYDGSEDEHGDYCIYRIN